MTQNLNSANSIYSNTKIKYYLIEGKTYLIFFQLFIKLLLNQTSLKNLNIMLKFDQKNNINGWKIYWYLLQKKLNRHLVALENPERRGFELFAPLVLKTTKIRGKYVNYTTLIFSNYLWISTNIDRAP